MVAAPEVAAFFKSHQHASAELDALSDKIDAVNVLKGQQAAQQHGHAIDDADDAVAWNNQSAFDNEKDKKAFRQYTTACERVKAFYVEQHTKQTYAFNLEQRRKFMSTVRATMSVWEALELLDTLVDESDPDTDLGQIQHLLQTAEAIRKDGKPEWMQVVGLVHDLGKLIHFFRDEGDENRQWDVVGDTFVVGCEFSDKCIYPGTFAQNPDSEHPVYSTKYGVYKPNCGIENVMLSWGHDEYLYHVFKSQSTLPAEGLAMIRYHSFYPWHREGAYQHLMKKGDEEFLEATRAFNPYDLYSKSDAPPKKQELKPYYESLIAKFFPSEINF